MLATLGSGASEALILKSPRTAETAIANQVGLAHRLLTPTDIDPSRVRILNIEDSEALETALYGTRMPALAHEEIALLAGRREVAKNIMAAFIDYDGEHLRSRLNWRPLWRDRG